VLLGHGVGVSGTRRYWDTVRLAMGHGTTGTWCKMGHGVIRTRSGTWRWRYWDMILLGHGIYWDTVLPGQGVIGNWDTVLVGHGAMGHGVISGTRCCWDTASVLVGNGTVGSCCIGTRYYLDTMLYWDTSVLEHG